MTTKPSHPFRIVTCCYCGARSTLGREKPRHLVCHGCGAPVRKIETLQPQIEKLPKSPKRKKPAVPHQAEKHGKHLDKDRPSRRKKGKRRYRPLWSRLADAFDDFDDVFEDIVDIFD